jgi:integral membrane protein
MINDSTIIRRLRFLAMLEAITLVVLSFVAVPLKHLAASPLAVSVMGPIHGLAFLLYVWTVANAASGGLLRAPEVGRLLAAAMVPFGGFFSVRWIAHKGPSR